MIFIPLFIILAFIVLFQQQFALGRRDAIIYYGFVVVKFLSAVLVGLLYKQYYQIEGDTFVIFNKAKAWYELWIGGEINLFQWLGVTAVEPGSLSLVLPTEPRTRFFAFIVSYLMPISQSNYYVVAIWLTLLQVFCLWLLAKAFLNNLSMPQWVTYIGLLFIPSLTFWSAGLLKETLMLAFMAIIVIVYLYWSKSRSKGRWFYLLVLVCFVLLLYQIKYYVVILMLPLGFVTHLFAEKHLFNNHSFKRRLGLYLFILIIVVSMAAIVHPVFNSGLFFELIKISHDQVASKSAEALIQFNTVEDPILFMLINLPLVLLTSFFRPFLWEVFNGMSLAIAVETFLFTLTFIFSIYSVLKIKLREHQYWWLLAALLYVIAAGLIITLSTPNFGSLVRYRVAYMPIFWMMTLWLINKYFSVRNS